MESRIHGDMYVRFGGRLVETYYRKVEKRCWPSLLKICTITWDAKTKKLAPSKKELVRQRAFSNPYAEREIAKTQPTRMPTLCT